MFNILIVSSLSALPMKCPCRSIVKVSCMMIISVQRYSLFLHPEHRKEKPSPLFLTQTYIKSITYTHTVLALRNTLKHENQASANLKEGLSNIYQHSMHIILTLYGLLGLVLVIRMELMEKISSMA